MLIRWLNAVALGATVTVNVLANTLPINGRTPGQISDSFDNPVVPAGYVFSIWAVIYSALIGFVSYQLLPSQRSNPRLLALGPVFILSCVCNMAWLFAWHYGWYATSLGIMVLLAVTLMVIWKRLGLPANRGFGLDYWLISVPFLIYLGWITVATFANLLAVMEAYGLTLPVVSRPQLAAVCLVIAGIAAFWVSGLRGAAAYALVIVWAGIGVALKQTDHPVVVTTAWVVVGVAAASALWALARRRTRS